MSTEIYGGESLEIAGAEASDERDGKNSAEMASRIVWTTPRTRDNKIVSQKQMSSTTTLMKETVTAAVEVFPSKRMSSSGTREGGVAGIAKERPSTTTVGATSPMAPEIIPTGESWEII